MTYWCVCVCVRACVHVCVRACVRVCVGGFLAPVLMCSCGVCDHMHVWWCVPPLSCPTRVQEMPGFQSTAQVERLLLEHGEKVVDIRRGGAEIDEV